MKHQKHQLTLAACALIITSLLPAHPALAQSGRIFQGEAAPETWGTIGVTDAQGLTAKPVSNRPMVTDQTAQAAMKANIARALAPTFELAGDVTFLDAPLEGGLLGRFRQQPMLSVPVRYRNTATLDADFKLDKDLIKKGTVMYRRFLPQAPGKLTGTDEWCGIGSNRFRDLERPRTICLTRTPMGRTRITFSDLVTVEPMPPYYIPLTDNAADYHSRAVDQPFPSMTPVPQAPADMTAELMAYPVERGDGYAAWARSSYFIWRLKKGHALAYLGYTDDSIDVYAARSGDFQVFRMAWMDLVYKYQDNRLIYQGYIDLVAENPDLAVKAQAFDSQLAGGPPEPATTWSLGALDFAPDSLVLNTPSAQDGKTILTLKGHVRQKVRLLEGLNLGQPGHFEAGDVFYASLFDSAYYNGATFVQPGWCGTIHKAPILGGVMSSRFETCFLNHQYTSANIYEYKDNWETMSAGAIFSDATSAFPSYLPRYEVLPTGPEDDRDAVIHIHRDPKGKKPDVVVLDLAIKRPDGEKIQRIWTIPFDATGTARFNLWTRRLIMTRDGDKGVKVTLEDGGDGLPLRGLE